MFVNSQVTCWVVTDGKIGMENQCVGLAEALGLAPVVKRIQLRSPWRELSPFLRHGLVHAFSRKGDKIVAPFPDLLIATGRASIPASLYVKRASRAAGKPTFTVQLQNPVIDPSRFDLVVVPRHDGLTGPNVMTTRGALHRVTPALLEREAAQLLPRIVHLPRPYICVLIGGSNAVYQLTPREMAPITEQLRAVAKASGGSLIVTPSRRTGADNLAVLQAALKDTPCFIWDGAGPNPYFGMLGVADTILVTGDSVNMVTEACRTGKPVYVIDLAGGSDKFRRFHQAMRDDGYTRQFAGDLTTWRYPPLDDMDAVTARVRMMMGIEQA
jgi:mitochondrial fission protein ELM1